MTLEDDIARRAREEIDPDYDPAAEEQPQQISAREARRKLESFTHVTIEVTPEDARAIACVRRPDVAYDESEPASADEIREHLEGVIEGIREEVDPDA